MAATVHTEMTTTIVLKYPLQDNWIYLAIGHKLTPQQWDNFLKVLQDAREGLVEQPLAEPDPSIYGV